MPFSKSEMITAELLILPVVVCMLVCGSVIGHQIGEKSFYEQFMTGEGFKEKKFIQRLGDSVISLAVINFALGALYFIEKKLVFELTKVFSLILFFISALLCGLYTSKTKPARLITYHRILIFQDLHSSIEQARSILIDQTIECENNQTMNQVDCTYISIHNRIHHTYYAKSSDGYDNDVDSYIIYGTGTSNYKVFLAFYILSFLAFATDGFFSLYLIVK